jgi:hypothetical protein
LDPIFVAIFDFDGSTSLFNSVGTLYKCRAHVLA